MPDRRHHAPAGPQPADPLVVPTVAAWQPDAGDPELLAWQLPDDQGLLAAAFSSPVALDQAMPGGQPWIFLRAADLVAVLAAYGPHQLLVDPTLDDLAGAGAAPTGRPADLRGPQ